jgi:adenosylcobinamide amidohydrolase
MSAVFPAPIATSPVEVLCQPPWLAVTFADEHDTASWAIVGGGIRRARVVVWHQISEEELRPPVDARALLGLRMHGAGYGGAVALLTSRALRSYVDVTRNYRSLEARCIATVGLGNALRAGDPPGPDGRVGTINVLCRLSVPLASESLLEALALAAEARALAVREAGIISTSSGEPASGTGTDCIVVAAPKGRPPLAYAGKHTVAGHLVGASVRDAVAEGVRAWTRERMGARR